MPTKAQLQADLKRVRAERDAANDALGISRTLIDALRQQLADCQQDLADCETNGDPPQPWRPYNPDSPFNKPIQ